MDHADWERAAAVYVPLAAAIIARLLYGRQPRQFAACLLSVLWTLIVGMMGLTSIPQRPTPPVPSYANTASSDGRTVYDPQTSESITRDEAERRMFEHPDVRPRSGARGCPDSG